MKRRFLPVLAALALVACAGASAVKPRVLTPPPSAPRTEFFIERPEVQSREVGEPAWQRNGAYGQFLADALRSALADRGKVVREPPAEIVRARVYVATGRAPVAGAERRKQSAHVEVRLQLIDHGSGTVIYSTHTLAPLPESMLKSFGIEGDPEPAIRDALTLAAQDFASRL